MRILQLVQKPQRRGAETFAFELSEGLRARGDRVRTVYIYPYSGNKPIPLQEDDVVLNGSEAHLLEKVPGFHPRLAYSISREIQRFDPDIVQVNGARTLKYGALSKATRRQTTKWKLVYRNIDVASFWNRSSFKIETYRRLIMPWMDGVIGVSQVCLQDVMDLYKMSVPSLTILNGIDESKLKSPTDRDIFRERNSVPRNSLVLLFVGSLVAQKRPDRFLRVIARLLAQHADIRAWIVGDGSLREEVEELAGKLKVSEYCTFFGYQDRVSDFVGSADIFVMTSDTEGIPAVALEASYLRLPIVATNVGGMAECVHERKTGLLAGEPFEENLQQALMNLISSPKLRLEYGKGGRDWVMDNCTMETTVEKYAQFYSKLLEL